MDEGSGAAEGGEGVVNEGGMDGGGEPMDIGGAPDAPVELEALSIDSLGDLGGQLVKLTVDGEEVTISMQDALKGFQLNKASQKRMEEAARMRKEAGSEIERLLKDADYLVEKGGTGSVEGIIERLLLHESPEVQGAVARAIERAQERAMMTPEQKRAAEREQSLAEREARIKQFEEEQQSKQQAVATEKAREQFLAEFEKALPAAGLPNTPAGVARVASLMYLANEEGLEMSAAEAATIARGERQEELAAEVGSLKGEQLLRYLGPAIVRAVNEASIEYAQSNRTPPVRQAPQASNGAQKGGKEPLTMAELRAKYGSNSAF